MNYLISLDDFKPYRPICENVDSIEKLDPYIKEAQMFDLMPLLGEALYYDMLKNLTVQKYQDLLHGIEYVNTAGNTVEFEGIKAALCYWSYAQYIQNSGIHDTPYGPVSKRNEYSDAAPEKSIARLVTNARSSALVYWGQVKKYLTANYEDYPLWNSGGCSSVGGVSGGIKITAVGDDSYYGDSGRFSDHDDSHYHDI